MNYDLEMEKQINNINEGDKLLLHACCAPCSSACLERLGNYFDISIFYYNPNITEEYDPNEFFEMAQGLESEPERGARCYKCYKLRLRESAKVASDLGFDYFCTTLTLSPHKNSNWINEIGSELDKEFNSTYLYSDFKKKNGYKRSIELSKEYDLYRQDYCGCIYSKRVKMDE